MGVAHVPAPSKLSTKLPSLRPSMFEALGEFRMPLEATVFWLAAITHPWPHADADNRKVVLLIPGFMAGDVTLAPMANFLRWLGHRVVFGGIWSNSECPRETMRKLNARLALTYEKFEQPIVIIGQSLGGVYARELARENPEMVERVISLGAPIRTPRETANYAVEAFARSIAMLRGRAEGCLTETCKCGLILSDESPGEVPSTNIYSRTDGVVHWQSCIDTSGAPSVENVEVMGSHVGMAVSADVYRVIADRLVLPNRAHLVHRDRILAAI